MNLQMAKTVTCIHTQADALSIPVIFQAREDDAAVSALDGLDQRPFLPHNLLNELGTTLFRVFSGSQGLVLRSHFPYSDFLEAQPEKIMKEQ